MIVWLKKEVKSMTKAYIKAIARVNPKLKKEDVVTRLLLLIVVLAVLTAFLKAVVAL